MDDYGVEEFKSTSADSKATADKTPVDDVQKTSDKLADMKVSQDPGLYKHKKKEVITEEVDEDAMYSSEPNQIISNTDEEIQKNFQTMERNQEKFVPSDTLFIFMGEEFLYLDYKKDTWAMGDVDYEQGQPTFTLP